LGRIRDGKDKIDEREKEGWDGLGTGRIGIDEREKEGWDGLWDGKDRD